MVQLLFTLNGQADRSERAYVVLQYRDSTKPLDCNDNALACVFRRWNSTDKLNYSVRKDDRK